jgi:hypothetical protein
MNKLLWIILLGVLVLVLVLVLVVVFSTTKIQQYTYKSSTNTQKGIIVIRHAQDVEDADIITGNFTAPIPCNTQPAINIYYQQKRLNPDGISSAKAFSYILNQVVTNSQIAPITDIYVKNPDQNLYNQPTTSNPFMTVYPYICDTNNNISPQSIHIYQNFQTDIQTILNNSTGSVVICWDAESLWSGKSNEYCGRTNLPVNTSIMYQLDQFYQIPDEQIFQKVPQKGSTIYTYISPGNIKIFNMTIGTNGGGVLNDGYVPCI